MKFSIFPSEKKSLYIAWASFRNEYKYSDVVSSVKCQKCLSWDCMDNYRMIEYPRDITELLRLHSGIFKIWKTYVITSIFRALFDSNWQVALNKYGVTLTYISYALSGRKIPFEKGRFTIPSANDPRL